MIYGDSNVYARKFDILISFAAPREEERWILGVESYAW